MLKEKGDGLEAVWPAVWRKVSGARHNLPEGVYLDDDAPPTYRPKKTNIKLLLKMWILVVKWHELLN